MDTDRFVVNLTARKVVTVIISFQLLLIGLVFLDTLGITVTILRQLVSFISLTFIPGFLIFKSLRKNDRTSLETLLYSVGLSVSFLMFSGAAINFFYPLFGIKHPISEGPLLVTSTFIVFLLCSVYYLRNRDNSESLHINKNDFFTPSTLSLLLLPFLAVFGAYTLNSYNNNIILLFLLAIIAVIPSLSAFNKIPYNKYPLVVWIISVSLLLHNSLIGHYVSWGDAPGEYIISNLVLKSGFWDKTIPNTTNSLLSIAMLHPAYSIVCNLTLTWVYKVIYPVLFSLTPLVLYLAFKRQTSEKIALLSSSLFMFSFMFFTVLSRNTRTGLSLLFLSLLILLMTDKRLGNLERTVLLVITLFTIGVTYYGVSYMLLLLILPVALMHYLFRNRNLEGKRVITPTLAILFVVFSITWFTYTSDSSGFNTLVGFGRNFMIHLSDFLTAYPSTPTHYVKEKWSISLQVVKYLIMFFVFTIMVGILSSFYRMIRGKEVNFHRDYFFFSLMFSLFLLATLVPLPGNVQRIFQISLVFLAPFSVIGFNSLFKVSNDFIRGFNSENSFKFFSVLLLALLVFSSGLVSAVLTHDLNPNELINKEHVIKDGNIREKEYFYRMYLPYPNVHSSKWLLSYPDKEIDVYGGVVEFYSLNNPQNFDSIAEMSNKVHSRSLSKLVNMRRADWDFYIHLGYCEYVDGVIIKHDPLGMVNTTEIAPVLYNTSKLYDNGGSALFIKQ